MSEDKIPSGMKQIGVIVKGGGINVDHFVEQEKSLGNTCVDCGDYVMICQNSKGKR